MSVHYVLLSYLLEMYLLQLSTLMPLHYRHGFHSRLAYLCKLLRYCLGICVNKINILFCEFCRSTSFLIVANKIGLFHFHDTRHEYCGSWFVVSTDLDGKCNLPPRNCLQNQISSDIPNFSHVFKNMVPLFCLFRGGLNLLRRHILN